MRHLPERLPPVGFREVGEGQHEAMRRRPSPLLSVGAAVLVALLTGCADDSGPDAEPTSEPTTSESPSGSESPDAVETPVAGSGADVDPADLTSWCGAITPAQVAGATGFEVAEVTGDGEGVQSCDADLPGAELLITWGSESTGKSFERYAAGFDRPAGVYESSEVTLDGGQPAVVALQDTARSAVAGTVVDGRLTQVAVIPVGLQDADPQELGEVARQMLAVYFA